MMVFDLSKKDFIYFLDILPNDFMLLLYKFVFLKTINLSCENNVIIF